MNPVRSAVAVTAILFVSGCALWHHEPATYERAAARPALEIPPDLATPATTGALPPAPAGAASSTPEGVAAPAASAAPGVLPASPVVALERAGGQRWLRVAGTPSAVWSSVRAFFIKRGYFIAAEHPAAGIFVTDWRSDIIHQHKDFLERHLGKLFPSLYSNGGEERYRVRLEPGTTADVTEVYVQHQGIRQVVVGQGTVDTASFYWEFEAPNPELDAEMLSRLGAYLAGRPLSAQAPAAGAPGAAVTRDKAGHARLELQSGANAWQRVGVALGQAGATVTAADATSHVYQVEVVDPGMKSGSVHGLLQHRASQQQAYGVRVTPTAAGATVEVLGPNGAPDDRPGAVALLQALERNLR